ncbi:MAG: hypothetical protein H8E44_40310 [Planctomycetes bacterium]|nr:hypothetical protein [Planctomycetota bacterium]
MKCAIRHSLPVLLLVLSSSQLTGQEGPMLIAPAENQEPKPVQGPQTFQLVVQPAAEPQPPLKYWLLPRLLDRRPGNAAVVYGRALAEKEIDLPNNVHEYYSLGVPLRDLQPEKLEKTLSQLEEVAAEHQFVLEYIHLAAHREQCDWELPLRDRNLMNWRFSILQKMRNVARLLALQARLQITRGDFEEAIETLKTGYAVAAHVGKGNTLIHGLVGISICDMMSAQVRELVQQPDAPNLYWALAWLPQPFVDLRPALDFESQWLESSVPELRDLESSHPDWYWQRLLDKFCEQVWPALGSEPEIGWRGVSAFMAVRGYPAAKRALVQRGRSPEEVDAMPVPQVLAIEAMRLYTETRDDMFKWFAQPYWQAHEKLQEAERHLHRIEANEVFPLVRAMLPHLTRCRFTVAKNSRTIAMLQTVEALRLHAANHGQLPKRLKDVTAVPIPIDPTTGSAFRYHQPSDDTAILESPAPPDYNPTDGLRFEIKLTR